MPGRALLWSGLAGVGRPAVERMSILRVERRGDHRIMYLGGRAATRRLRKTGTNATLRRREKRGEARAFSSSGGLLAALAVLGCVC